MDAVATNPALDLTPPPPAPGTELALLMGCRCPDAANAGGKGAYGGKVGGWWIDLECPLHGLHGRAPRQREGAAA